MFRLLGFPVHVRPGFVMFMLLIVVIYGNEFGLWLAGSLAVLTLLHELGHAAAARQAGAEAEISLDFLAGYASYVPTRPISRLQHAWISFAGPATQIAISVALLMAMGANPLERSSVDDSPATLAIWWAGPIIGLLNLIPILPLDGGNIVLNGLDRVLPGRSRRPMLYFSIALTGIGAVLCFTSDRYRGFGIFVAFLMVTQFQMLSAGKRRQSAWDQAYAALQDGKENKARRILVAALSNPHAQHPAPTTKMSADGVAAMIDLLPEPLPHGDPTNEYLLANLMIRIGRYEDAAHYAAGSFERTSNTLSAATIARAAAALGDHDTAVGWLQAAAEAGTAPAHLATVIDTAPELIGLRQHPDVVAVRRSLAATPAA